MFFPAYPHLRLALLLYPGTHIDDIRLWKRYSKHATNSRRRRERPDPIFGKLDCKLPRNSSNNWGIWFYISANFAWNPTSVREPLLHLRRQVTPFFRPSFLSFDNAEMPGIGSSAAVYGIVSMIAPISFEVEPIWECFIDDESTGTPTTIYTNQNRQKLCPFNELDSSKAHILATHTTSNQQLFWIDYIECTPSATVNFTGAFVSIQHDDHSLGYDDTWQSSSSGAKSTSERW